MVKEELKLAELLPQKLMEAVALPPVPQALTVGLTLRLLFPEGLRLPEALPEMEGEPLPEKEAEGQPLTLLLRQPEAEPDLVAAELLLALEHTVELLLPEEQAEAEAVVLLPLAELLAEGLATVMVTEVLWLPLLLLLALALPLTQALALLLLLALAQAEPEALS